MARGQSRTIELTDQKKSGPVQRGRLWKDGLLLALANGASIEEATKTVGIGQTAYYEARKADPQFALSAAEATRSFRISLGAKARSQLDDILNRKTGLTPEERLRAIELALRESHRGEPKVIENTGTMTVKSESRVEVAIKAEREVQTLMARRLAEVLAGRGGVDPAIRAQHESAKKAGGNGGNGGNGGGH